MPPQQPEQGIRRPETMKKSQFLQDLKQRLISLLEDPVAANARNDRIRKGGNPLSDALSAFNASVSEEILNVDPASVPGDLSDEKIEAFKRRISFYMKENGSGCREYDTYITILTTYLALVIQKPLHPSHVRRLEGNPPEDSDNRYYCGWKTRYIKEKHSLCRCCNCLPWP